MGKHNKTCRICKNRKVKPKDDFHPRSSYSFCNKLGVSIDRLQPKCNEFEERTHVSTTE